MRFDFVKAGEQCRWFEIAGDNSSGIGIGPLRWTDWRAANDRRLRVYIDIGHFERIDGFGQYAPRCPDQPVPKI